MQSLFLCGQNAVNHDKSCYTLKSQKCISSKETDASEKKMAVIISYETKQTLKSNSVKKGYIKFWSPYKFCHPFFTQIDQVYFSSVSQTRLFWNICSRYYL